MTVKGAGGYVGVEEGGGVETEVVDVVQVVVVGCFLPGAAAERARRARKVRRVARSIVKLAWG